MNCDTNIAGELAGIDLSFFFVTEALLSVYSQTLDTYGGRNEIWTPESCITMVAFAQDRPGPPQDLGERKEPGGRIGIVSYLIHYPRNKVIRVRDRWRIDGIDYEVLEVQDKGQWSVLNTNYCSKVDQYEPVS